MRITKGMGLLVETKTEAGDVAFGKTPLGQLMYDLAFVTLTDKWLARKHGIPVAEIRAIRRQKAVKKLVQQNAKRRMH